MTDHLGALLRAAAPAPAAADLPQIAALAADAGLLDVAFAQTDSPLGPLLLAASDGGLARIAYLDDIDVDTELALGELAARISPRILRAPRKLDPVRRELDEFFAGRRQTFELALDLRLASAGFPRRVLAAAAQIPFGATRSYKEVATAAGSPNAFRAAGTALGHNPLPIVIPCHRVRHAGGGIGGYTGGLERKRTLLEIESGD